MIDPFGRTITYLRVSVTDRCDFRCVYCMAEEMTFLPKKELLTLEELDRVCSAFIRLGVKKLRLTGGEPLVRRDIMTLFRALGRHIREGSLEELTLTTNGSQLARYADELRQCGVRRVNVSVDTLDPAKFTEITRRGRLDQVLEGLAAAKKAGLAVKINTVALRGVNEDELDELVAWCGAEGFDLVIIEVMPMGDIGGENRLEFATIGDTVNVASRLEALTRELGIEFVVSDDLVRAMHSVVGAAEADALMEGFGGGEAQQLRGRSAPVQIYVRPRGAPAQRR